MNIKISEDLFISDIKSTDKKAFIELLQEKQIHDQTLNIPFPYAEADADWWIKHVAEETKKQGQSLNWAIRQGDGNHGPGTLIGGIGFNELEVGKSHKAEIGYWLGKPYWGKGIATKAAQVITDYGFSEFKLIRITANVFAFNIASAKVLEKIGYQFEGTLKNNYKKNGQIFDGKLYAKTP